VGLGLTLSSEPVSWSNEELLDRVNAWVKGRLDPHQAVSRGDLGLSFALHPTAEPVGLLLCGPGTLSASAKTSTTGPGYHAAVVELLAELAAGVGFVWRDRDADGDPGDETGYFSSRDYADLERQMLAWLRALATGMARYDRRDFDVCLPIGHRYLVDAHTRTPLGPRDLEYWRAVAEDPRRGRDFFAWWERGQGAGFHLGIARSLMWTEVRWRKPCNERETAVLRRVADSLQRAYELAPRRDYPWREWGEILSYLGKGDALASEIAEKAPGPETPLVGYRRHDVQVPLTGGWSIRLPGRFAEEWEEGTFCGWADGRTAWFTSYSSPNRQPPTMESLKESARAGIESFEEVKGEVLSHAVLDRATEDGEEFWQLSAQSAFPGGFAVLTVCFPEIADRDWALRTWRSLAHQKREPETHRATY
jgi:hypothetical protein